MTFFPTYAVTEAEWSEIVRKGKFSKFKKITKFLKVKIGSVDESRNLQTYRGHQKMKKILGTVASCSIFVVIQPIFQIKKNIQFFQLCSRDTAEKSSSTQNFIGLLLQILKSSSDYSYDHLFLRYSVLKSKRSNLVQLRISL